MKVQVCNGKVCGENGSQYIFKRVSGDIEFQKIQENCNIEYSTCQGKCQKSPCMKIDCEQFVQLNPVIASKKFIDLYKKLGKLEK